MSSWAGTLPNTYLKMNGHNKTKWQSNEYCEFKLNLFNVTIKKIGIDDKENKYKVFGLWLGLFVLVVFLYLHVVVDLLTKKKQLKLKFQ